MLERSSGLEMFRKTEAHGPVEASAVAVEEAAARKNVGPRPRHDEVVARHAALLFGLDVEYSDGKRPGLARQARTAQDVVRDADATTEKGLGLACGAKAEKPGAFQNARSGPLLRPLLIFPTSV